MKRIFLLVLVTIFLLSSCGKPADYPEPEAPDQTPTETSRETASPSPTDKPPVVLTVCTSELPDSLFLYADLHSPAHKRILNLLYPTVVTDETDPFTSSILTKLPDQADGTVRFEPVEVRRGQTVVDARGELVTATEGASLRPSGCYATDCAITWNGLDPLEMDQMVIEYTLREELTWLDGTPVKAEDSIFSFNLANDPDSPFFGWAEDHTRTYIAIDEQTVSWNGYLGFTSTDITKFFWLPLPSTKYESSAGWADIVVDEAWISSPPAYGAFKFAERTVDELSLVRNPSFPYADEVLSGVDQVTFRTIEGGSSAAWSAMQAGSCDVLDSSFQLARDPKIKHELDALTGYDMRVREGKSWTQLVFGIAPAEYDALANALFAQRPNYLGDERTRQGIAQCLNRDVIAEITQKGFDNPWPSFLPPGLSQLGIDKMIMYDPQGGSDLLETAGWRDHDNDPDTPRMAQSVENVFDGTLLNLNLLVSNSAFHQDLAVMIEENLAECGIGLNVDVLSSEELYAPGPEGPLFGRSFDLALIAWQSLPVLDCGLYTSWNIPNAKNGWIGTNIAGLDSERYNSACANASLSNRDDYNIALMTAEEAFIDLLPAVPLVSIPEIEIWRLVK